VKTAGLTYPHTYAWAPDSVGIQQLQEGQLTAATPLCYNEAGWQLADGVARYLTGMPIQQSQKWENYVIWSNDYNNVPKNVTNPPCIANFKQQFEALWH
jgi:hypothetical protein